MLKAETRGQELEINLRHPLQFLVSSYYSLASKSCVQVTHNHPLTAGITTQISHSPAYKNYVPVYKQTVYTPTSVQTPTLCPPTSAQYIAGFYRWMLGVIPTMHRAY